MRCHDQGTSVLHQAIEHRRTATDTPVHRAPSYVSKNSFWAGNDDDDESLLKHDRLGSYSRDVKPSEGAVRVVSQVPSLKSNREKRRKLQGWRFGVTVSAWTAFTVLMLNFILTIYVAVKFGTDDGVGTAFLGQCDSVNSWTTWIHILINALSSILLSASNYTMQCLCSPTRQEIDKAHARGDWMDIGVASVRNIFRIRWQRSLIWWCLALSSVPIHLLYNSAVFKSLDANEYTSLAVNADFLAGKPFNNYISYGAEGNSSIVSQYAGIQKIQSFFANNWQNTSAVANLTNTDCIAAYGTSFVSSYNNVLAVTSARGNVSNYTVFDQNQVTYDLVDGADQPPYFWICEDVTKDWMMGTCDVPTARQNATNWTLNGAKIDYCLAEITPSHCKLQFSLQILVTVILMNACKSACMFLTLWRQKDATLVTVGDAMTSFLDHPDERTKGRCLMSKVDVYKGPLRWRVRGTRNRPNTNPPAITYYAPMRRRWFAGASIKRWVITMSLCAAGLITGASLLGAGAAQIQNYLSDQSVFSLGFGAVDSRALINTGLPQGGAGGLVSAVLLANCPQAIVSFLYLTYNGLFTSMLLCHEYSKYGMEGRRKPLRVTTPHGQQRKCET